MFKYFAATITIASIFSTANAFTLKEKKRLAEEKKALAESSSLKQIKEKCGVDIPASFDEKMITPFMEANTSVHSYCEEVTSTLASMCGDETSKTEIVKKVKKVKCMLGEAKKVEFKLNGTELVMKVGPGASNLGEEAKKYLEGAL